jgi:hypothetical protein
LFSQVTQRSVAARGGFIDAARQALNKLGVPWEPTDFKRPTTKAAQPKCRSIHDAQREPREVQVIFRFFGYLASAWLAGELLNS